jgi:MFS family permease
MLSLALAAVAWSWVAVFGQSTVPFLFIGILFVNIFIALGDVICDGMMVEISQKMEADYKLEPGSINRQFQSSQWVGAMVAITLSAFGGGIIAQFFDLRSAALVSGLLPLLLIFLIASAVHEEKVQWDPLKARQGYKAIGILIVVALIFIGFNRWHPDGLLDLAVPIIKVTVTFLAPGIQG